MEQSNQQDAARNHFCIFGRKPVLEAFKAGRKFDKILLLKDSSGAEVREIQRLGKESETPVQSVPKEKLESVARKYSRHREANHQGVIGFLALIDYHTVDDVINLVLSRGENPLLVVLDHVTDVGNFGAIARSAECLGAHALVVPSRGAAQINAEAMKASAGALNKIHVCREGSLITTLKFLKASGVKVFGASMREAKQVADADFSIPCAIVLGSEGEGISPDLLKLCDEAISIPTSGVTDSLNVSVSAGIILYEAMKQRGA